MVKGAGWLHDQPRLLGGDPHAGGDLGLGHGHDPVEQGPEVGERPLARATALGSRRRSCARHARPAIRRSGRPSESRASAASSGSTPITRTAGRMARAAAATPLASPPPPTGTRIAATSGRSSTISRPQVPWPAMIRSSSYGGITASPRSAARRSATSRRSSLLGPTITISAPSAATRARLRPGRPTASPRRPARRAGGRPGRRPGRGCPRVGDHPARAVGRREAGDGDVRAAELECADRLERLGLQEVAAVRRAERDERRAEGDAGQRARGGPDVVERDEPLRRGTVIGRRPRSSGR